MNHFVTISKLRLLVLVGLVACLGSVQAQDDLQDYINKISSQNASARRTPSDITEVDLSQFSATNRKTTLNVANGKNFRFINGTLTRDASLDGPIMHIGGGSYVEISTGATINARQSSNLRESIFMDGGELAILSTGAVYGSNFYDSSKGRYPDAIVMTSDNDVLSIEGDVQNSYTPTVDGAIVCEAPNASIIYKKGLIFEGAHDTGAIFISASDITFDNYPIMKLIVTLTEKSNVVNLGEVDPPIMDIKAPQKVSNDAVVKASREWVGKKNLWKERIQWKGNTKYDLVGDTKNQVVKLSYDDLQDFIDDPDDKDKHCGCSEEDPYTVEVPCDGMNVKKDVEFPEDDLYWFINGKPEGMTDAEAEEDCDKVVDEGEHDVRIRPGSHVIFDWTWWHGCGCQGKHIWVWGTLYIRWHVYFIYYWRFIHVMPGGKVVIQYLDGSCDETVFHMEGGEVDYGGGKCSGGKYGWYCTGGTIYIRGGRLSGGTCGGWTGTGGHSYHYDGTVHGGIHNYGWHYWYGGYCTGGGDYIIYNHKGGHFYYYGGTCGDGGTGKIWNEGDLYIDGGGSVSCGDIYCVKGGCIYILKKLTFTLHLVFTVENIVPGETIVVGGDGYTLTQDDIDKIQIDLPDGYEWHYDGSCGCISITQSSDISGVGSDRPAVKQSYDASGRQVDENRKGLNIQRMSDGSVRKVTTK